MNIINVTLYGITLCVGLILGGVFFAPDPELEGADIAQWRTLKTIDDRGFALASRMGGACSRGFDAFLNQDVEEALLVSQELEEVANETAELAEDREEHLKKLGY